MVIKKEIILNYQLQTLRGVACLLVVYFHVIGTPTTGLKLSPNSLYSELSDFFIYIRMPLFTFLSGYVYGYRRFLDNFYFYFKGKFRRIIIPFIVVSSIFVFVQTNVPGANNPIEFNLLTFYLYPYAHFWFLQSIFTIFIFYSLFDYITKRRKKWLFYLFIVSMPLFFISELAPDFFSLSRTFYLLPFFTFGVIVNVCELDKLNGRLVIFIFFFFVGLITIHGVFIFCGIPIDRIGFLAFLIGLVGPYSLLKFCFVSKLFIFIGAHSYSIYLYHVFGTAFSRIFLNHIGLTSVELNVFIGLILGVFIPILFHRFIIKNRLLALLFLGLSSKKNKSSD